MMTTTQDKLGGITDVMKQADLFRQGSVGQFYAANGGRIGYDAGGQTGHPPITTGQVSQAPPQMPGPAGVTNDQTLCQHHNRIEWQECQEECIL